MAWIDRIPFMTKLLNGLLRKLAKMYLAQEKLLEAEKQIDALKNILVKEVEEKQRWKEEVNKVKAESHKAMEQYTKDLIGWVIDNTYKRIEERYFLVPKEPIKRKSLGNILGHLITSSKPEDK